MRLWFLTTLLVQFNFTSPQPVTNENGKSQSNIECCPCPKDQDTLAASSQGAFIPGVDWPGSSRDPFGQDRMAGIEGESAFIRSGVVDDCPCRFRDADSSAAPSLLLPTAVRSLWPVVSGTDKPSKENPKPLLHPEVDFASSVLETLRQATDEEYEDALTRDAARSVVKAVDPDLINVSTALDTAKSIVNVLLNPTDLSDSEDGLQEASHVQESRCIHPLGSDIVRQQYSNPSSMLNDIITTTKQAPLSLLHRNVFDMDSSVEASNLNEQIVGSEIALEGPNLNSNPSLLKLFSDKNNLLGNKNGLALRNMNTKQTPAVESEPLDGLGKHLEILNTKFNNTHFDLKRKLDQTKNMLDNNLLSDILQNQDPKLKFKQLLPVNKLEFTTMMPYPLKNFLKLKDVELIPPVKVNTKELNKPKLNVPQHSHTLIEDSDKIATNIFKNFKSPHLSQILKNGFKFNLKNGILGTKPTNIQPIPNNNISKFKVVDAITSPSEMELHYLNNSIHEKTEIVEKKPKFNLRESHQSATNIECTVKNPDSTLINKDFQTSTSIPFEKIASTEILNTYPSASEIHEFEEETPDEINQNSTLWNQLKQNDDESREGINNSEEKASHEDNQNEESEGEDNNDSEEVEDKVKNLDEDKDKIQGNCLENPEGIQDFEPESNNTLTKLAESEENQTEVKDTFSDSGVLNSNEFCDNKDFSHIYSKEDSLPETSQNVPNIILPEEKQGENSDQNSGTKDIDSHESNFKENSNSEGLIKFNSLFEKSNKLSSFTENILRRLGDLSNKKVNKSNEDSAATIDNEESETRSLDACGDESSISVPEDIKKNEIAMIDLQHMSDKLLHLGLKREQEMTPSEAVECEKESSATALESKKFKERPDSFTDENDKEMIDDDNIELNENKKIVGDLRDDDSSPETNNVQEETDNSNKKELCLETSSRVLQDFSAKEKLIMPPSEINEMTVAASGAFEDRIKPVNHMTSPLLRNIIHHKPSKTVNNLKETTSDIRKPQNFPILEDIKENLPNIFEQHKNNVKDSTLNQQENMNEIDPLVEANTPKLKSILPSLSRLQDVDLDIFQLKPFTLSDSHQLLSKIPRLNLNSYKAKLALPKSIDLKPMKLTSSLGDKHGLFGATLTIPSNKISSFVETPGLLGSHLDNLPSLEELRTTLRENAQNLLVTPLETTGRNMIEDTFRSGQTISDNIRSHTKNAVKNIQQTLETTLQDAKEIDLLGDSVRNPQDLMQAVARRHEDFSDKLKGIHYDLNGRLESLRDRIAENPLLPSFASPVMRQNNFMSKSGRKTNKDIFLSSRAKSNTQFPKKSATSRTKYEKNKTFKMPAASSVPVPKTVEVPKLKLMPPKPSLLKQSSLKTPQLLTNKKSISELLREPVSRFQNSKIPVLSRSSENKIKISFSTTPRPNLSTTKNKPLIISPKFTPKSNKYKSTIENRSKLRPSLKPLYDTSGAPSEISTSKLKSPLSMTNKPTLNSDRETVLPIGRISSKNSNPSFTYGKTFVDVDKLRPFTSKEDKNTLKGGNKLLNTPMLKPVKTPNNKDILTTLREAVRERLSNVNSTHKANKLMKPNTTSDMTKSASENIDMVSFAGQSVQENTSYTCKMTCSRTD